MSITYEIYNPDVKIEVGTKGLRITNYYYSRCPINTKSIHTISEITYFKPQEYYYFIIRGSKLELPSEIANYEIKMNNNDHEKIQEVYKLLTDKLCSEKNRILGI
jgi:hypothetical protein